MKTRNLLVLLTVVLLAGSLLVAPAAAAQPGRVVREEYRGQRGVKGCLLGSDDYLLVNISKLPEGIECSEVTLDLTVLPNRRFMLFFSPSIDKGEVQATIEFYFDKEVYDFVHYGKGQPELANASNIDQFSRYSGWF